MKPTFRCGTRKAIDELAEELNLPNELTMQDWEYTAGNPHEIEKYISHYVLTTDDDKKFVLMELIIQATEDQATEELFITYWNKIKPILEKDFKIHEYTIYYWSCFDSEDINDCWRITTFMRQLWKERKNLRNETMILKKGITGFSKISSLTIDEVKTMLKNIRYPYIYSNIVEPQISNNYFRIEIEDKINKLKFSLLINSSYYIIAGVTAESKWLDLQFIDLPIDFTEQIKNDDITITGKNKLETKVPNSELEILDKQELKQIKYWKCETYGEVIFNGYD